MNNFKLIGDFELFREHCILLRQGYNTYTNLFNEENRELLNRVAPAFFSEIAEIMHRDWLLQVCKIMDPASTTYKKVVYENITINLINEQLERCNLSNHVIKDISQKILNYGSKITPARNKRLAHYDREQQVNNAILGETTEEELLDFVYGIQKYCDEVGNSIGVGPLDFSVSGCAGDVLDLIKYLGAKS